VTTVLVTGGAGYIGAHCAKALAAAGFTPVVYDSLVSGHADAVRWGPLEVGDLADAARLDEVIARHRPVAALHFAALIEVGASVRVPLSFYRANVAGSLTLIERLLAGGVDKVVFSSTCAIYGVPAAAGPLDEGMPQGPISPYGRTKRMVEEMLADAAATGALSAIALRYFNAAGASAEGEIGERHDPETHLIPLVLAAARDRRPVAIFGTDYPTRDGTCVRDYVHVDDLASAHVAALQRLIDGTVTGFRGINLGTGRGLSVKEIVAAAERVTGCPVPVRLEERRPGDPPELVADAGLAARLLGWTPLRSDPETILSSAWRFLMRDEPQFGAGAPSGRGGSESAPVRP
jgi:UDP-glucose 4-epimerase